MGSENDLTNPRTKELLDAQAHIGSHILSFLNSMALKCAIELGIPDVIHKHGKPMTIDELAISLSIHPSKNHHLHRLMRFLVHSNFFSKKKVDVFGEDMFDLTINSQLLVKDHPFTQAPMALSVLDPAMIEPAYHLSSWFMNDSESPFHIAHGRSFWEHSARVSNFNECFKKAMASDTRLAASLLVENDAFRSLFKGVESWVDVGGGDGTMARAIAEAFPELKCVVLDLPHVVKGLQSNLGNLVYVAGDMFKSIPPCQAVLLKWILHDWSDEHCIKILQKCKEAIPSKDKGGKIIIIDIVMDDEYEIPKSLNPQVLCDMEMMSLNIAGKERSEEEWRKLFLTAGFKNDYKILHILGPRSVIEIYPQ